MRVKLGERNSVRGKIKCVIVLEDGLVNRFSFPVSIVVSHFFCFNTLYVHKHYVCMHIRSYKMFTEVEMNAMYLFATTYVRRTPG